MKLLFNVLLLFLLTGCTIEDNTIEPISPEENIETEEFSRSEMVQAQLPKLMDRTIQEPLDKPLAAVFFEEDFMLVNVLMTEKEVEDHPLLFALTDGEAEITIVFPKEGRSPVEIDDVIISGDSDFEVNTSKFKVIERSFSDDVLKITVQTMNLAEFSFEFTQTSAGIFVDEDGNEFRALSGSLDLDN